MALRSVDDMVFAEEVAEDVSAAAAGFVCHNCQTLIGDGVAIYMFCDAMYCSHLCRRRSRRSRAREADADELARSLSGAGQFELPCSTCTNSDWTSTSVSDQSHEPHTAASPTALAFDLLRWLLGAGLRKIVPFQKGFDIIQHSKGLLLRLPRGGIGLLSPASSKMLCGMPGAT
mmetsp:Transcript_97086/g.280192  ORF Transcript_97086/g.280192 Transcript_97086/m.280192 type:complete len:174 (+) Transcript_97086:108-629(+)